MTHFLDAEIDYHERCTEELRRVRQNWPGTSAAGGRSIERRPTVPSRSSTATHSYAERLSRSNTFTAAESDEMESTAPPVRMPIRPSNPRRLSQPQQVDGPVRPIVGKTSSFQGGASLDRERGRIAGTSTPITSTATASHNITNVGALRGQLRPVSRIVTGTTTRDDVFADRDDDTASDTGSPSWGNRSTSSATSIGSLSRTPSNNTMSSPFGVSGVKKAPPPPPPSRSKKPPPPVPTRREAN
jgi:hypothetical protein